VFCVDLSPAPRRATQATIARATAAPTARILIMDRGCDELAAGAIASYGSAIVL